MVYLASNRSLAVLEVLVHLSPAIFPINFCLSEFEVPADNIIELSPGELPNNWQDILSPNKLKKTGDAFLKQQKGLLLKVPSAIIPEEFNYLLNPLHPSASKIRPIKKQPFSFDERLV